MLYRVRWGTLGLGVALLVAGPPVRAQQGADSAPPDRAQFAGMQRASGEITAVAGNKLTLKTPDGETVQVVTTDNTRVMKGRGGSGAVVKVTDLKVGDGVMAAGNLDAPNKTLHAALVVATDAAEVKKLRDNLGKTYIVGKVTAIDLDNATMTVERPDKVAQKIGFDESTSFRRGGRPSYGAAEGGPGGGAARSGDGGESITLADIKVGDEVRGEGSVKGGTFVPALLSVSTPGQYGRRRGANTGTPGSPGGSAPPQ